MNNIVARISDFYCSFVCKFCEDCYIDSSYFRVPLMVQIGPDINSIKYFEETNGNYFIYDKQNFKQFEDIINTTYEELYCSTIIEVFKKCFEKYKDYVNTHKRDIKIDLVYDEVVLDTYGKDLYFKALNNVISYFKENCNYYISFNFIHSKNAFCGEVLDDEIHEYRGEYDLYLKDPEIVFHNKIRSNTGLVSSKQPELKCYFMNTKEVNYRQRPLKYLIFVDIQAHITNIYTYCVKDENIKLYQESKIDYGFMDMYYWMIKQTYCETPCKEICELDHKLFKDFKNFKDNSGKLTLLTQQSGCGCTFGIYNKFGNKAVLNFKHFNLKSPIKFIVDKVIEIKYKILNNHRFEDEVIIEYNLESYCHLDLYYIENNRMIFNAPSSQLLKCLHYVEDLKNDNLCYRRNFTNFTNLIYEQTGLKPTSLILPLKNVGYNYTYNFYEDSIDDEFKMINQSGFKSINLSKFEEFKLNYQNYETNKGKILKLYSKLNNKYCNKWYLETELIREELELKNKNNSENFYNEYKEKLIELGFEIDE